MSAGPGNADKEVHRGRGRGGQPAAVELSKLSAGNGATGVDVATGITAASLNGPFGHHPRVDQAA